MKMIDIETADEALKLYRKAGSAMEKILLIGLNDLEAVDPVKAAKISQGLKHNDFSFTAEIYFTDDHADRLQFFMMTKDDQRTPLFNFEPKNNAEANNEKHG